MTSTTPGGAVCTPVNKSIRLQVDLSENPLVDVKKLLRKSEVPEESKTEENAVTPTTTVAPEEYAPRTNRFNIIERLERRYGSLGAHQSGSDESAQSGDDDDLYDSADSFIDDTELHQTIEDTHAGRTVETRHDGFFVNKGDHIETQKKPMRKISTEEKPSPVVRRKRKKASSGGAGAETEKAIKRFMEQWAEEGRKWKGSDEVEEAIVELQTAATELFQKQRPTRNFSRALDPYLAKVDKLVVAAHPQGWRVNPYIARLMLFLPFTATALKANMARLQAKALAMADCEKKDELYSKIVKMVKPPSRVLTGAEIESVVADPEFGRTLFLLTEAQQEWIKSANDYRRLLKSPDKSMLEKSEYQLMTIKDQRAELYTTIIKLFPDGAMDLARLKTLQKKGKSKGQRKRQLSPVKSSPVTTPAAVVKIASATPASAATPSSTTKKCKAPKSRRFYPCPKYDAIEFCLEGDVVVVDD